MNILKEPLCTNTTIIAEFLIQEDLNQGRIARREQGVPMMRIDQAR